MKKKKNLKVLWYIFCLRNGHIKAWVNYIGSFVNNSNLCVFKRIYLLMKTNLKCCVGLDQLMGLIPTHYHRRGVLSIIFSQQILGGKLLLILI